jgi:PAS domain S-box-containing protein
LRCAEADDLDRPVEELVSELNELRSRVARLEDEAGRLGRAETSFRQKADFLDKIFDCIQDGISVLDKDFNIIMVNRTMEEWYRPMMPIKGKKCYHAYHCRDKPCEICPSKRAMELKTVQSEIHPLPGKYNRQKKWLEIFSFPLVDDQGNVTGVIEHVRDITRRKEAETALRESEENYRSLVENINDMVWEMDKDFRVTYASARTRDILGYEVNEVLGKQPFDFILPADLDVFGSQIDAALSTGKPLEHVESRVRRKDGQVVWLETNGMPILDEKGQFAGYRGINRDVTERKQAETALLESKEKYCRLVENIDDWVWEVDENCRYTYSSPRVSDMLGYRPEELIGKTPFDLMDADEAKRVAGIINPLFKERRPFTLLENNLVARDGSHICVETNGTPLFAEDGTFTGYMGVDRDIGGRKDVEKSLKLTQFTMDRAGEMVLWVAPDSHYIYVNQAACQTFGYTRDEMNAMTTFDTCPSWTEQSWAEHWKEIKERGSFTIERPLRKKDGSYFPAEISVNYLIYDGKEYNCSFIRDITERKRADDALRVASAYNRSLIEASVDPLVTIAPDGRITDVNMATERVTGFPRKTLVGTDFSDYFTDPAKAREGYLTVFKEGSVRDYPLEIRHRDGHVTPVIYNASVYRDESGKVIGVFAAARDITVRKRAQEALMESERKFRALAESTRAGIVLYRDKKLIYVNPMLEKITGYAKDELTAMDFWDTVHPEHRELVRGRGMARQHGKDVPPTYEFKLLTKDGETKWVELSASNIEYEGKPTVLCTLFDITDRKRSEAELQEAKGQSELYLDLMGHDINNLNQIGIGFLEMALDTIKLSREERELIARPLEALEASTRLIANVRKLQKVREGGLKFHDINIGKMILDIVPRYRDVPGREVRINCTAGCDCMVRANDLLDDVFSNIIGNAIKHSSGPLDIDVFVSKAKIGDREYCLVAIEDTGPGIPDGLKERLFTRFEQGGKKGDRKGIGMYLVNALVQDFHGRVWVEDRVRGDHTRGARFMIMLPAVEP